MSYEGVAHILKFRNFSESRHSFGQTDLVPAIVRKINIWAWQSQLKRYSQVNRRFNLIIMHNLAS